MPECIIIPDSYGGGGTPDVAKIGDRFHGEVFMDLILNEPEISIVNVNFTPGSRTAWHYHEGGQLLQVLAGSGWVCDKGGKPKQLKVGDICWCRPGTVHWHGADDASYMVHQAVAYGKVQWYDPITEEEYAEKNGS